MHTTYLLKLISNYRDVVTLSKKGVVIGRGLFLKYNHDGTTIITLLSIVRQYSQIQMIEVLLKSAPCTSEDLELPIVTSKGACTLR